VEADRSGSDKHNTSKHLKTGLLYNMPFRTSQESHYVSAIKINPLMLRRKIISVYCVNHTKHKCYSGFRYIKASGTHRWTKLQDFYSWMYDQLIESSEKEHLATGTVGDGNIFSIHISRIFLQGICRILPRVQTASHPKFLFPMDVSVTWWQCMRICVSNQCRSVNWRNIAFLGEAVSIRGQSTQGT
jgi:hypothetical protein